jgi:FkbM family methyltransferase
MEYKCKEINGTKFFARSDGDMETIELQQTYMQMAYYSERSHVEPGDIVVDCGANYGSFTKMALDAGARLVVGYEPHPEIYECYSQTFFGKRVIPIEKGVYSSARKASLQEATNGDDSVMVLDGDYSIQTVTLDESLKVLGIPRVDFLKMDIEGVEREAIRGGMEMIKRDKPKIAICIYHSRRDEVEIPKLFSELGYELSINENGGYHVLIGKVGK